MLFTVSMEFLLLSLYIQEQFIQLHPEGEGGTYSIFPSPTLRTMFHIFCRQHETGTF